MTVIKSTFTISNVLGSLGSLACGLSASDINSLSSADIK